MSKLCFYDQLQVTDHLVCVSTSLFSLLPHGLTLLQVIAWFVSDQQCLTGCIVLVIGSECSWNPYSLTHCIFQNLTESILLHPGSE